jgi:hypothetical protein
MGGTTSTLKKDVKIEKQLKKHFLSLSLSLVISFFMLGGQAAAAAVGAVAAQRGMVMHSRAQVMIVIGLSMSQSSWTQHPFKGMKPSSSGVMVGPV